MKRHTRIRKLPGTRMATIAGGRRFAGNLRAAACQLISAAIICVCGQNASAQLLFSEGFNYTPGNGLANEVNPGNGLAWVNGNTSELKIGSAQLTYPGLQEVPGNELVYTSSGSASSSYNTYSAVTSGSVYYSFVIDCTLLPTGNNYISAVNPGTTTPSGSGDAMATYVGASGTGWKIGVRTSNGGTGAAYSGTLLVNQDYFVVEQVILGSSPVVNLFVDPTPGGSPPAATATQSTATAIASVDDIGFKVQSATTTGNFDIDSLLIGESWADVTPAATTPEPDTFALLGGGVFLLPFVWRRLQKRA